MDLVSCEMLLWWLLTCWRLETCWEEFLEVGIENLGLFSGRGQRSFELANAGNRGTFYRFQLGSTVIPCGTCQEGQFPQFRGGDQRFPADWLGLGPGSSVACLFAFYCVELCACRTNLGSGGSRYSKLRYLLRHLLQLRDAATSGLNTPVPRWDEGKQLKHGGGL